MHTGPLFLFLPGMIKYTGINHFKALAQSFVDNRTGAPRSGYLHDQQDTRITANPCDTTGLLYLPKENTPLFQ